MVSIFDMVATALPVEVFELTKCFNKDKNEHKVNLGVGAYRDNEGKPWVLPVVRKAETRVVQDTTLNHEYLPILGNDAFCEAATLLVLGEKSRVVEHNRAFGIQTLSGTGALKIGAVFLNKILKRTIFYYSDPTWENHVNMFLDSGFKDARTYRYWDQKHRGFDFTNTCKDLAAAPTGSVIIFHACAHNPTGADPTLAQWKKLAEICLERKLFPFFDCAYQGFASGDPDRDAWAIRHFADIGLELFIAQSFAKNFGLYNERIGNLVVVQRSPGTTTPIKTQFSLIIRTMYSNPPAFGSRIVHMILTEPDLRKEWMDSIQLMSSRIRSMRQQLLDNMTKLGVPGDWNHIVSQIGLFSYTGLTPEQVKILIRKYHIYLLSSGRINVCGLNECNVDYVAKAIHEAIKKTNAVAAPEDAAPAPLDQ